MPDKEYLDYLDAIMDYVQGERIYPFSAECFTKKIIDNIIVS